MHPLRLPSAPLPPGAYLRASEMAPYAGVLTDAEACRLIDWLAAHPGLEWFSEAELRRLRFYHEQAGVLWREEWMGELPPD